MKYRIRGLKRQPCKTFLKGVTLIKLTRRHFIKNSLVLGGSLLLSDFPLYAANQKELQWYPAYGKLEQAGKLAQRVEEAYSIFEECELCPRQCGADRLNGEQGFCEASSKLMVYSTHPHFGEEISLVGRGGSGTIFFSKCNLRASVGQDHPLFKNDASVGRR